MARPVRLSCDPTPDEQGAALANPSETTPTDCSVIIPTHRGEHRLPRLLDALSCQDYSGKWEILVVVDGRLDDSERVLETYKNTLPLRVLVHELPQGVTHAMNAGFENAVGRIVIRCDDDLTPKANFVRAHMAHHGGSEPIGVIGPTRDVFPDNAYAAAYGRPANQRSLAAAYARPENATWIGWAANNSAPRALILKVGGFDPAFVYGQDSELGYRLHEIGLRIVVEPTLEIEHRGPSSSTTTRVPRAFVSGASKRLFYLKHPETLRRGGTPTSVSSCLWHVAVELLAWSIRSRDGFALVGAVLDKALQVLPTSISTKLVALAVEAAGLSGIRHGLDDLTVYRGQKTAELQREPANVEGT